MDRPTTDDDRSDDALADSERAATHRTTEDIAPGVIKDGHGEIQPDPYPDRPEKEGDEGPDREVLDQHRADAHDLEHPRTGAANETLGTTVEPE
jgi:hypothetical protein